MLGFLPTRAYRPGTPGATTFLSPLSGTFNYGWDSFRDSGKRPGLRTDERQRLKDLEREVRELKRANEILRKASAYFAQAELDR